MLRDPANQPIVPEGFIDVNKSTHKKSLTIDGVAQRHLIIGDVGDSQGIRLLENPCLVPHRRHTHFI